MRTFIAEEHLPVGADQGASALICGYNYHRFLAYIYVILILYKTTEYSDGKGGL
jgi:hypothetical protein